MTVVDLLARLRKANVTIRMDQDRLRYSAPPGALGPELREELAAHKGELMEFLRRASTERRDELPPIDPARRDGPLPLSFPQRRMWFFEQVRPGTATYHMGASWRLRGDIDVEALRRAFVATVWRHEALRTRFVLDGEEPAQEVVADPPVGLPVIDLAGLESELPGLMAAEHSRPFDLTRPPLIRVTLIRLGAQDHVLLLTIHHIAADMWSAGVLVRELMAHYRSTAVPAPEPTLQYADFATWQRTSFDEQAMRERVDRCTRRLIGAPSFLELPTDRPRPRVSSYAGRVRSIPLPAGLVEDLDALCRRRSLTRFMVLLTAFDIMLSRYSGETDILVGAPVANRSRPEVEAMVGFFVNTVVLRANLGGEPSVAELLDQVRDTTLDAWEYQDVPVEQVVEALHPQRDPNRPPLFQVMFVLQNAPMSALRLPGLAIEALPDRRVATEFDLTLEISEQDGGLRASLHYNADLFDAGTADRMLASWRTLLAAMLLDQDQAVTALPLLSETETQELAEAHHRTDLAYEPVRVHERIARQAALTPDATALVFRDRELSYAELNAAATALAARLRDLGAEPDRPVALCVERSPEMVVGLLAVLKSGAAYLPLDSSLPEERLDFMLADAGVGLVVTSAAQRHRFEGRPVRLVLVEDDHAGPATDPATPQGELAYVIYTSGSTGRPKGVMVEHGNLTAFLTAIDQVLDGSGHGVWLALTSVSFDIAALEMFWPLTHGWKVVVQDEHGVLPGAAGPGKRPPLGFSLFYFASTDDRSTQADPFRLLIEGARFADQHGFQAIWTPERHFDPFGGLYPNPSVTAAALATITSNVRLRAGSAVVPLHNPVRVAEEWAVVDNLSGGRVGLSVASGWHADDFALAADPAVYARRKEAMLEGLEQVRRLWRGEEMEVTNGAGRTRQVRTYPRPVQPELPVWLTAAGSPETFRMAGELGAGVLTHLLGQSVDDLRDKIAVYRQAYRAAGHEGQGHVTLMVHTFLGTDPVEARQTVRAPFREYLRSSFGLVQALAPSLGYDSEPTEEDLETLLDFAFEHYVHGSALIGTVEECTVLADRLGTMGVDEVGCLVDFGVPADAVLDSLPLLDTLRRGYAGTPRDADYGLAAQIERHGVTHVQCTPSLAAILTADPATRQALRSVRTLLVGGEALPPTLAVELAGTVGRLVNMYGPTETTIWSTTCPVDDPEHEGVSIGRPIANTSVHILDQRLNPLPVGVPGELCIGGHGVARGYLGRPALTAERFVPSPYAQGGRLYRTGDRARYLPNGRIEFLGRIDRQIKLGGHRIELGEIENVLLEHPVVQQAAVVLRPELGLVAYLVSSGDRPSPADLRAWLGRKLSDVASPTLLEWLDEIPLNSSGKIDYRALPEPDPSAGAQSERTALTDGTYVAPRDQIERTIAGIWAEVLKVDAVGMRDNFFELGGHSLMAIQLVSRLRSALAVDVTLRAVFESVTVAQLAERVREAGATGTPVRPAVAPVLGQRPVPLSFAQQRMWFFDQMNPGSTAHHLTAALRLDGPIRPREMRLAFEEIVRRHEILRTNFAIVDGELVQVTADVRRIPLPLIDLSWLADPQATAHDLALAAARRPFDLESDPLLRTALLRLDAQEHWLLLTMHHIVSDSWSIGILVAELGALYQAYRAGGPSPLPDLPVQYADFTVWQRDWLSGEVLDRQLQYWRASLDGAPEVMAIPSDRPRPAEPTRAGAQTTFRLGGELSDAIRSLSRRQDVTVFVTLLAAFNVLLHRWSGEEHVVLGVPVAGREAPELEPLIGFFANTLVLHTELDGDERFEEVLSRVRDTVIGAYEHQDLPVEKLVADLGVDRSSGHNPLFQAMFVFTNDLVLLPQFADAAVTPVDLHQGQVFVDLNMAMEDGTDGLRGTVDYSTELFDADTISRLLDAFGALLRAAVDKPDTPVRKLPAPRERPRDERQTVPIVVGATFTANPVADALSFWSERLELPVEVSFAPYNQLFQEVLDPASGMARNQTGINVALLRSEDWSGGTATPVQVGTEFAQALATFQRSRATPMVVVLCPPTRENLDDGGRWRSAMTAALTGIPGVVCLDTVPMLALYEVGEYDDPISFSAGRVPYTAEFFAALGTILARQVSALVSDYPKVVLMDGGWSGPAARLLGATATALAQQGRRVYLLSDGLAGLDPAVRIRADAKPLLAKMADVLRDDGETSEAFAYLTADQQACAAVAERYPAAVALTHPAEEAELTSFLNHTWLLDPPGLPIPSEPGWRKARQ